jgi:hypothetical protein
VVFSSSTISLQFQILQTRPTPLKDRLQEVPKGDKWSRRHFSFPGNFCLLLRDISALRKYTKKL